MSQVVVGSIQVNQVVVQEDNGAVIVEVPNSTVVEVVAQGPQGPSGSGAYVYSQPSPSTIWTINHNLGIFPAVELLDAGGQEIDGEISHTSVNQTIVRLNPASAGLARLT